MKVIIADMQTIILVGARFHSVALADTLKSLGYPCEIYTSANPRKFKEHPTQFIPMFASITEYVTGVSMRRFELPECAIFDRMACALMGRFDLLYGWAGYSLFSARKAKKEGKTFFLERSCPHVLIQEDLIKRDSDRLHLPYKAKPEWWLDRVQEEYKLADRIVVPSLYTLNSFLERGFSRSQMHLAPLDYGVKVAVHRELRSKNGKFVVGTLGGNTVRKGYLYLFEAWDKLKLPNAKLVIRALEKDLRQSAVLAQYLNSNPNIEFIPYVPDIADFYDQCDLFCLPSIDDGFGLAATEAIAHGVPTLVTKNVGASELFQGVEGVSIVDACNADALAEKILYSYKNRESLTLDIKKHGTSNTRYRASIQSLYEYAALSFSSHDKSSELRQPTSQAPQEQ